MTRTGFWFDYGLVYAGGLNYFRNLLYAVNAARVEDIETVLFIGNDLPAALEQEFARVTRVVKLDLLTRGTVPWLVHRSLYRAIGNQLLVKKILKDHRIDVVSHASMIERLSDDYRLISWIPDFQYLHLPQMFPGLDGNKRSRQIRDIHRHSDAVVVSSRDAFGDFASIVGEARPRATYVLPFVSQTRAASSLGARALIDKYRLTPRYFLLPNQFWAHKNHCVAFEAIALLKQEGIDATLVCTGLMVDPNKSAAFDPIAFAAQRGLQDNIRLLGSIDYGDVLGLMRGAVAVLNPSLFEGWSSSVEEAKSMGKPVIVSDIAVHREQAHPGARYFDPKDAHALASLLKAAWRDWPSAIAPEAENAALADMQRRTVEFGSGFVDVVRRVTGSDGSGRQ